MAGTTLPPAPGDLRGRQMGNYEVICRLSAGGMAEIFLASRKGLAGFHKPVVLKKILPDIQGQEEFVQMFLDEARVTAGFNHPNIAQVFDLDVSQGELFLAMEFVPGATLLEIARVCGVAKETIPIGLTLATVRDTALALHYAHTHTDALGEPAPVIHRDVAEKNIMVTYEGVTKLLDFGIAKSMAAVSRTQVGMVKGTSGYMSPEQILGEPLDARSDLFSLGVVLHECLTGMRLFPGKQPAAVINAVLRAPIPEPSRTNKSVPPELDAIVLKVLSRNREDRYATALEFARALERAVGPLVWLPEQSSELLRRLFAERREQTRQMLAMGRSATGEQKLSLPPVETPPPPAPASPPPRTATPAVSRLPSLSAPQFSGPKRVQSDVTDVNLTPYAVVTRNPALPPGPGEARGEAVPPSAPPEPPLPASRARSTSAPPEGARPSTRASPSSAPEPAPARSRSSSRAEMPATLPMQEEEPRERDIKTAIIRAPRLPTGEHVSSAPPPPVRPRTSTSEHAASDDLTRPIRRQTASVLDTATQPAGTPALASRPPAVPAPPPLDDEGPDYVTLPQLRPPPPVPFQQEEETPSPITAQVHHAEPITTPHPALLDSRPPSPGVKRWVLGGLLLLVLAGGAWLLLHLRSGTPAPAAVPAPPVPAAQAPGPTTPGTPPAPTGTGTSAQPAPPAPAPESATAPEEAAPEAPVAETAPASPKRPKTGPGRTKREPASSPVPSPPPTAAPVPSPASTPSPPPASTPEPPAIAEAPVAAPVVSSLDPEQVWHVLERVRAGTAEPSDTTGLLTITTDQYAQVYLGSHLVGETPLFNVTMPTGHYALRLMGPGNQPMKLVVDIKVGEPTKRRVSFDQPTE